MKNQSSDSDDWLGNERTPSAPPTWSPEMRHITEMIVSPIGAKFAEAPFAGPTFKRAYDVYWRGRLFIYYRRCDLVGDKVG